MSSDDCSQAATLTWLLQVSGKAAAACTVDCLRTGKHCIGKERQPSSRSVFTLLVKSQTRQPFVSAARSYLSDGGAVGHAGRVGALVVGIVEAFLVRGDLVLPVDPVVPQLGHPLIKQVLLFNLGEGGARRVVVSIPRLIG